MKKKTTSIHVHRAVHQLSQQELAKRIGTSRQTIHSIENGKFTAGLSIALKLASFFKVTVEDLFNLNEK